jgi:acylphosphatase
MADIVSRHVTYSGRVQGVGFRYTARQLASGFAVTGYVRNLPGGDLELVAEGAPDQVDAFLAAVARRMADSIDRARVNEVPPAGHDGFSIRH